MNGFAMMQNQLNLFVLPNVSLVLPVFNEAGTVGLFWQRVREAFRAEPTVSLEMVFVDDGSSDHTLEQPSGGFELRQDAVTSPTAAAVSSSFRNPGR
jgi:hypothetical protein